MKLAAHQRAISFDGMRLRASSAAALGPLMIMLFGLANP